MFPNQIRFGKDIANAFGDPKIRSILAVAMTQSGKTGSMLSVIEHVPHEHVFLITGLSSVEWMDQTKSRFPEKYRDHIFHRNQLPTFVKLVKNLSNVLIIIDENQVAFKKDQTIHKCFVQAGLMDLEARNIRLVHFTATPSNTEDFVNLPFSKVVLMNPDSSYVSAFQLLQDGRILEYKDLCGVDKERADLRARILDHAALVKEYDEHIKSHKFLMRKTAVILKNQLALQKKTNANIEKLLLRIDKTHDILKKSEHMLEKLVLSSDLEQVNLLIRQNQNSLDQSESSLKEYQQIKDDSTKRLADAKNALLESDRLLEKLEKGASLQDKEQLLLVGGEQANVFQHIREIQKYIDLPKYHIIRTSHSYYHTLTILHFKRVFKNADFLSDVDMDDLLAKPPLRHTFLFIKEKLRCAKTLVKDHLGVLYERITDKPQMETILQGLVGRLTGYHNNKNSVVFSNPQLVKDYKTHWDQQFRKHKTVIPQIMLGTSI